MDKDELIEKLQDCLYAMMDRLDSVERSGGYREPDVVEALTLLIESGTMIVLMPIPGKGAFGTEIFHKKDTDVLNRLADKWEKVQNTEEAIDRWFN